jgi:hypothetical protein
MHDKVFISYAKEDYTFASELYEYLIKNNFIPWLDKKEILPGQDWNFVIRKALREANYIILLLSSTSVQKRGYVQREFTAALDFVEEKLEDDIYLIPLKINNCIIPEKLSKFQWIEYNAENSFQLILSSLMLQREKYLEHERNLIAAKEIFAFEEYKENFEYGNHLKFTISTSYFQFTDIDNQNLNELNAIIKGKQAEYIANSRKEFYNISGELVELDFESINWRYETTYAPNLISKNIISVNENSYQYTGGAHGNGSIYGLNFHLNPFFKITLQELFEYEDTENVLQFFSNYCYEELRKIHNEWLQPSQEEIDSQTPDTLFWEGSLAPKWENFEAFFISKIGFEIIFNAYSVCSYAFGVQIVTIPYETLLPIIKKPDLLKKLISKLQ